MTTSTDRTHEGRPCSMQIDFGDATVESVRLDYMLNIEMDPLGAVHIEVPVRYESAGTVRTLAVGEADLTGDPAFDSLVGCSVTRADAADDGTLTLEFSNGARLQAGIDVGTESWEVGVQSGELYFGGPDATPRYLPKSGSLLWMEEHHGWRDGKPPQ